MTSALEVARRAVATWRSRYGNKTLYMACQRIDGYYYQEAYQGNDAGITVYGSARLAALASRIYTKNVNDASIKPGHLLYWEWSNEWHVGTVIGRLNGRTLVAESGSKGETILDLGNHYFVRYADSIPFKFYGAAATNGANRERTGLTGYGDPVAPLEPTQRRANATARRRAQPTSQSEHVGGGDTDIVKGDIGNFVGWIRGEHVNGTDVWFKGTSGAWFHASGFEGGGNTAGLPDLNAPALATRERRAITQLIGRALPSSKAAQVAEPLEYGAVGTFDGWTKGENIDGEDRWVHGAFSDRWFSLRYLEPRNVDGLPQMAAPTTPAPQPPAPVKHVLDPKAPWKNQTPDSPLAKWVGSPNYGYREARETDHITLHWMAGTLAGTDAQFQIPGEITDKGRGTNQSTNYGVGLTERHQYVKEGEYVHSDGNADSNATAITIEHEGGYLRNGVLVPVAKETLDLGAELLADIAKRKGWKKLEWMVNVFPHSNFVATTCPGTLDYVYEIAEANKILNPPKPVDPKPVDPKPEPELPEDNREQLEAIEHDLGVIVERLGVVLRAIREIKG